MSNIMKWFAAYPARPTPIGDMFQAISEKGRLQNAHIHLWPENEIRGRPLTDPIFEQISNCDLLIADITKLNFNVTFEIGFAIGKGKPVVLVLNEGLQSDEKLFYQIGIFDTLGYKKYQNSNELLGLFEKAKDVFPINTSYAKNNSSPIYIVETPMKSDAMTRITSQTKKTRLRYRAFNAEEAIRLSSNEAVEGVSTSHGVIVPLLSDQYEHSLQHNIRAAFVAGLALGSATPLLILQDTGGPAPLDVRDLVKTYIDLDDIGSHIQGLALEVTELLQSIDPIPKGHITPLVSLTIGDPMAENEFSTLGNYFVQTDAFMRTARGEVNLVVGRKGMGKTALFSQVRDENRANRKNIVVDLKPEGYQLARLKEEILDFLSAGSQEYLVTAFWEYLLLLEICYKILEKDESVHTRDHSIYQLYLDLREIYHSSANLAEGDFSERLAGLSETVVRAFNDFPNKKDADIRLQSSHLTQLIYSHDIRAVRDKLSEYLVHKDSVWILFDNLDRGWPALGPDKNDILILRCLIEAGRKLQRSLIKDSHKCVVVVFVRNDVFELLMNAIPDFGKEMRVSLDWSDGELMRELLRRRLSNSSSTKEYDFGKLWNSICVSHVNGEDSFDYIVKMSIMRPRNLLKLFLHAKANAVNSRHDKITEDDIAIGFEHYSHDVLVEASREVGDIIPSAKDVLYKFIAGERYYSKEDVVSLISDQVRDASDVQKLLDLMMYFGFLGITTNVDDKIFIYDVHYDMKLLGARIQKEGNAILYTLNEAFWPSLSIH